MRDIRRAAVLYAPESRAQAAAALRSLAGTRGLVWCRVIGILPERGECGEHGATAEEIYDYAASLGADMTVLYRRQPALALLEFVRRQRITDLIVSEETDGDAIRLITAVMPKVCVTVVPTDRGSVLRTEEVDGRHRACLRVSG